MVGPTPLPDAPRGPCHRTGAGRRALTAPAARGGSARSPVHDVAAQDVLAAAHHGGALVADRVQEDEGHALAGLDGELSVVELGGAADEALVEVDHEREQAALEGAAGEGAIVVPAELLARVVA